MLFLCRIEASLVPGAELYPSRSLNVPDGVYHDDVDAPCLSRERSLRFKRGPNSMAPNSSQLMCTRAPKARGVPVSLLGSVELKEARASNKNGEGGSVFKTRRHCTVLS